MNKLKTLLAHRLPTHVRLHSISVDKPSSTDTWRLTRKGRSLNSSPGTVHDFIPTYC